MSWSNVYVQSQCWQGIAAIMGHFVDKRPFFVDKGGFFGAFSPVFPDVAGGSRRFHRCRSHPFEDDGTGCQGQIFRSSHAHHPMLTCGNQACDNGQTGPDDAQKFGVSVRVHLGTVRPSSCTMRSQTHPRRHRTWQADNAHHGQGGSNEVQGKVDAARQLKHDAKVGGEP